MKIIIENKDKIIPVIFILIFSFTFSIFLCGGTENQQKYWMSFQATGGCSSKGIILASLEMSIVFIVPLLFIWFAEGFSSAMGFISYGSKADKASPATFIKIAAWFLILALMFYLVYVCSNNVTLGPY